MGGAPSETAAGGVLWRAADQDVEILLVHRPRYQDWSLPKGKPEAGENPVQTAVREVTEETGLSFRVGVRLGTVDYPVGDLRRSVTYWSMRLDAGAGDDPRAANADEVDDFRWVSVTSAARMLSYPSDRHVIERFDRFGTASVSLLLLRHAHAGSRDGWDGPDDKRPLSERGRRQAAAAGTTIPAFGPVGLLTAPLVRCEQTVAPLAEAILLEPQALEILADSTYRRSPDETLRRAAALASTPKPVVACSQGDTIRGILAHLLPGSTEGRRTIRKGGMWVMGTDRGRIVTADYYPRLTGT